VRSAQQNVRGPDDLLRDDTFDLRARSFHEARAGLADLFERGLVRRYRVQTRVDFVERTSLAEAHAAGFRTIIFGLESGSDKVLKMMKKRISKVESFEPARPRRRPLQGEWILDRRSSGRQRDEFEPPTR